MLRKFTSQMSIGLSNESRPGNEGGYVGKLGDENELRVDTQPDEEGKLNN